MPKPKKKGPSTRKTKHDGKQESKAEKKSEVEMAKANAALLQLRLDAAEDTLFKYREATGKLARHNEELRGKQDEDERKSNEVFAFLEKSVIDKEDKIAALEQRLRNANEKALKEKEPLVGEYNSKISELEERYKKKCNEFLIVEEELRSLKEFQRNKAHMEKELARMKQQLLSADRGHKDNLARMERKFLKEKVRIEKEAEQRIAEMEERAHNEAILQQNEASRSVFKENVRLNESLSYHIKEVDELRKMNAAQAKLIASLKLQKKTNEETSGVMVKKMTAEKNENSKLKAELATLEKTLTEMTSDFIKEKALLEQRILDSTQASKADLDKLQKLLAVRERELSRLKTLARSFVEQRTELEVFFNEALQHVRQEINTSRAQYRKEAQREYCRRMEQARLGRQEYPCIRTFSKNPHSTNSVHADLEEAEKWNSLPMSGVHMSELTWEQKERVLCLLFAKMNGLKIRRPLPFLDLPAPS